ncbi:MAG: hypothetical protein AAF962_16815 [Actinomycetota bacterium]
MTATGDGSATPPAEDAAPAGRHPVDWAGLVVLLGAAALLGVWLLASVVSYLADRNLRTVTEAGCARAWDAQPPNGAPADASDVTMLVVVPDTLWEDVRPSCLATWSDPDGGDRAAERPHPALDGVWVVADGDGRPPRASG